ncbi:MAG: hypothetical protein Q9162_001372 [Coniocarpon cinnabarinum]
MAHSYPGSPINARQVFQLLRSVARARGFASTSGRGNDQFRRSDFTGQGFTGYYEPGQPTAGPLGSTSSVGASRITPRVLKEHLDQFVVGQERAKKVMSVAVYNHYQRIQELQRREDEQAAIIAQQERQAMGARHPIEEQDEFPGQPSTISLCPPQRPHNTSNSRIGSQPIIDQTPLSIEKSNLMVLGPSGTGKTLMAKTLARVLEVPFSMSDCTPFTQAGYIGEDVEVCISRLLAASGYDVAKAERGIICLDEIDKIATARVSHGKDVSGEGVQQALLKILEGTTVQVQAKQEKNNPSATSTKGAGVGPPGAPGNQGASATQSGSQKGETYNVNTDNILFICSGAFVGLHKVVMDRLAKGSIGFGARVQRNTTSSNDTNLTTDNNDPTIAAGLPENDELFRKHSPFFHTEESKLDLSDPDSAPRHNTLDLITPTDMHKYGLIPELIGRLPVTTALRPLTVHQLTRVLTEPRNALVTQYVELFHLSGIELRFSTFALQEIAKSAQAMGTGARGLRTVMERVLGDSMYEAPGSGVRFILVHQEAAKGQQRVMMWGRESLQAFAAAVQAEEDAWDRMHQPPPEPEQDRFGTFEQYREVAKVAGSG